MLGTSQGRGLLVLVCAFLVFGCSESRRDEPAGALPRSWIQAGGKPSGGEGVERPSSAADEAVRSAFAAHTLALETGVDEVGLSAQQDESHSERLPKDWTPWHLDGLEASFGVQDTGFFGILLFNGSASVKGTWQRQTTKNKFDLATTPARKPRKAKSAIKISNRMSDRDLLRAIEPAVRAAVATRSVRNENALRKNLLTEARRFAGHCRLMQLLPATEVWKLNEFQLWVAVTVEGQVSTTIAAAGSMSLYFVWQMPDETERAQLRAEKLSSFSVQEQVKLDRLSSFVKTITQVIPDAHRESTELRRMGFDFNGFQMGFYVGVEADFGIAAGQAQVGFKLIFAKSEQSISAVSDTTLSPKTQSRENLPVVYYRPASRLGISEKSSKVEFGEISRDQLKTGLRFAMEMGTYFAERAREVDADEWKLASLQAEFGLLVGGEIKLVALESQTSFGFSFERLTEVPAEKSRMSDVKTRSATKTHGPLIRFFDEQLSQVDRAMIGLEGDDDFPAGRAPVLSNVQLILTPSGIFGVNDLLNVMISPSLALVISP